jgi:hypothetical protein
MSGLHHRVGRAPSNFERSLPANESELVQQITKDPYNLSFLTLERNVARSGGFPTTCWETAAGQHRTHLTDVADNYRSCAIIANQA